MEIQEFFQLLRRRKFYLILIPLVTASLMFLVRFTSPRVYVSESQISTGLTINTDFSKESVNLNPYTIALNFSNLIENFKSKKVINRLVYSLLKHDLTSEKPFKKPKFKGDVEMPQGNLKSQIIDSLTAAINQYENINKSNEIGKYISDLLEEYEYTEKDMISNSFIGRKGSSDFVNISFTSENPELSAYVVNYWANGFIEYYKYNTSNRLTGSLTSLKKILDQNEARLNEVRGRVDNFRSSNTIVDSESNNVTQQLSTITDQINNEQATVQKIRLTLVNVRDKINAAKTKSNSGDSQALIVRLENRIDRLSNQLINDPDNQYLKSELAKVRKELQTAMYTYDSSPITRLDDLLEEESRLEVDLKVALQKISRLNDQYYDIQGNARNLSSKASTFEILQAELVSVREEYLKAEQEYNSALSEASVGSSPINISYFGEIAEDPKSRGTLLYTGLGFCFGAIITIFVIVALEFLDTRIKSPVKFKRSTGIDASANVAKFKNCKADFADIIQGNFHGLNEEESDSFMQILRKIRYEFQPHANNIFLFTSARKGSGKSFVLSSLAYSLSMIEKKILIIDTNFRNNEISASYQKFMDENNIKSQGLDSLLAEFTNNEKLLSAGEEQENYAYSKIISKTVNRNIDLIISQNINLSPSEIFSTVKFGNILNYLLTQYDFIFMEGAAMNKYSDSKELSNYSTYIIPIFSMDDNIGSADKSLIKFLEKRTAETKYILNNVQPEDIV